MSLPWETVAKEEVRLSMRQLAEVSVVEPTTETVHQLPVEISEELEASETTAVADPTAVGNNKREKH